MPIRPSQRARYPKDWKAIAAGIRKRASDRCECNGECGDAHPQAFGTARARGGRWCCYAKNGETIARYRDEPVRFLTSSQFEGGEYDLDGLLDPVRVVLTVAHLDHDPSNCDPANLLACCQRCHLRIDRHEHAKNARETRRARKAIGDLFALALAALLAGCPASLRSDVMRADCCEPSDAGADAGCEWVPFNYTVPALTEDLASDDRACRGAGLEPYRGPR